jgi:hypothetical protein
MFSARSTLIWRAGTFSRQCRWMIWAGEDMKFQFMERVLPTLRIESEWKTSPLQSSVAVSALMTSL